ncbi:MAG: O-antigen biosynthesis glycosyltransferase WbnI [Chlamydiia bacterium]|nr:O-antigen biosynthesis glycosyltransferase WbnI [Chlamydiia bacterium]
MKNLALLFISLFGLMTHGECSENKKANVGLCIMATGKYLEYAERCIDSARKHFCPNSTVTFFLFTDGNPKAAKDVVKVHQERLGWPKDTLLRFDVYLKNSHLFAKMDYIFATDADMLFVADVGEEILGEIVATQHPGYMGQRGTYEENPLSTACVKKDEGEYYFCGGFYGGSQEGFIQILSTTMDQINRDLEKNFIAVWHDESHLNRFFIDHKPSKVLSPSYCYPESVNIPYEKKLLALDKDHNGMRK